MPKTEGLAQYQFNENKLSTFRRCVLYITIGMLVPAMAFSAIAAVACQNEPVLPNAAPEIAATCNLPDKRTLHASIGGLEPIPNRKIQAIEIFSFPNDGELPLDDIHVKIWLETTNGFPSVPEDLRPIIRIGR